VFWKVPGTFGEVPGVFGKFRVFLGSTPGVLGSSGTFSEVHGCLRKLPSFGTTKKTRFAIIRLQKIRSKAKTRNFRPMFHAEPAGIRSWSSEPVVIRRSRDPQITSPLGDLLKFELNRTS
jgi:hypothetical protein